MTRRLIVAIVGRPNVGKSTLFNRLVGWRKAVVSTTRGTTRDRLSGELEWRGVPVTVLDTGGLEFELTHPLGEAVQRQARRALQDADRLVLVCDSQTGMVPADQMILDSLRPLGKPIIVAVNKSDNTLELAPEFFTLGATEVCAVSALHGRGIGELMDSMVAGWDGTVAQEELTARPLGLAIIGRQNVGKSSLFNAIVREERVIVSELPGTTRDAVDTALMIDGTPVVLIDTAGLRHRRKVRDPIDWFSMSRAKEVVQRCDVALVVLDATQGLTQDDRRLISDAYEAGAGLVVLVNKWDLTKTVKERDVASHVHRQMALAACAPVIAVSAKTGFGVMQAVKTALTIGQKIRGGVAHPRLLEILHVAWTAGPPPRDRGRLVRLQDARWVPSRPAYVQLEVRPRGSRLPSPFERSILKRLYAHPALTGIPVKLRVSDPHEKRPRARR